MIDKVAEQRVRMQQAALYPVVYWMAAKSAPPIQAQRMATRALENFRSGLREAGLNILPETPRECFNVYG